MIRRVKKWGHALISLPESIIVSLEKSSAPLQSFAFIFFFIILLRSLLEDFTANTGMSWEMHLHFVFYYLFVFIAFVLVARLFTGTQTIKIFKVFSLFFAFILLGPVVDFLQAGLRTRRLLYIFDESMAEISVRFVTFFGEYSGSGATPGLRLHIFILVALVFLYVYIKSSRSLFKSLCASFISYLVLFISSIIPIILNSLNLNYVSDLTYLQFFYPCCIAMAMSIFYLEKPGLFKSVAGDMRLLRVLYYLLLIVFGVVIGYRQFGFITADMILSLLTLFISIVCAIFFCIVVNNIADYQIDKISNPERPLFKEDFDLTGYETFGRACFVLSLSGAVTVSYMAFLLAFLFMGNYYIYSAPPVRFKRVPIFSKLTISLNSLFMTLLGFSLYLKPEALGYYFFSSFPSEYLAFFLLFTFAANFIDLKDYEGDKAAGIKTLPVLLGLKRARVVIGVFFAFPYLYVGYIKPDLFWISLLFCINNFLVINSSKYREKKLFAYFLSSIVLYAVALLIN